MDPTHDAADLADTLRRINALLARAHAIADPILERWAVEATDR